MNISKLNMIFLKNNFTIVIDWLSVYFLIDETLITEPILNKEKDIFSINIKNITLIFTGKGQQHFKYIWNIYKKISKSFKLQLIKNYSILQPTFLLMIGKK